MKRFLTILLSCFLFFGTLLPFTACKKESTKEYTIGTEWFQLRDYELKTSSNGYFVRVHAATLVTTRNCSATATIIDTKGNSKTEFRGMSSTLSAGTIFSFDFKISEELYNNFKEISVEFSGFTTYSPKGDYTVTYKYNNGCPDSKLPIKKGNLAPKPVTPIKDLHSFIEWYTDPNFKNPYAFNLPVKSNLTLYARFTTNYADVTNKITEEYMPASIVVHPTYYDKFLFWETNVYDKMYGSGVIFSLSIDGFYYCLSNCHVTKKPEGYSHARYQVEDYQGNYYDAELLYESPEYDLALLRFKATASLKVLPLANSSPQKGDEVIALGIPKSQQNSIKYGNVLDYTTITLDNVSPSASNVTFPVIKHNAETKGGSSGGPLLNKNFEIAGINYAASTAKDTGTYICSYAIPVDKIREFLTPLGL